jgi:hypothetical protein
MRVPHVRGDAPTAVDIQSANATLLQRAVQSLLRNGIMARMRLALVITLLAHKRSCGGRVQAEAAGSRASISACRFG